MESRLNTSGKYCHRFNRVYGISISFFDYQVGTDIEDFKCSWLVVKALELCNEEQKKLLFVSKKHWFYPFHLIYC